jgi:hypothetical protein
MWNLRKVLNFLGYPAQTASIRNAINLKVQINVSGKLQQFRRKRRGKEGERWNREME